MNACLFDGRAVRLDRAYAEPVPAAGEVRVRVLLAGVCRTDLEIIKGYMRFTGVLGHEFVGRIVEIGPGVTEPKIGDIITPDTLIHCGTCYWCQRHQVHHCENLAILGLSTDGGFAEYVNAPTYMCFRLPPSVAPEVGALAEPASVAVRASRLAHIALGDTVVILGAGTIGLFCLQTARLSGASHVYAIETEESRRAIAAQLGADAVIDPRVVDPVEAIKAHTAGRGADIVIECGGNAQTVALAPQLARKQGRVVLLSLHNDPVPINLFPAVANELELIGSFSHVYDDDFATAVILLGNGRVQAEPLITGRIGLDDLVEKGLKELVMNKAKNLKILVSPQGVGAA